MKLLYAAFNCSKTQIHKFVMNVCMKIMSTVEILNFNLDHNYM